MVKAGRCGWCAVACVAVEYMPSGKTAGDQTRAGAAGLGVIAVQQRTPVDAVLTQATTDLDDGRALRAMDDLELLTRCEFGPDSGL